MKRAQAKKPQQLGTDDLQTAFAASGRHWTLLGVLLIAVIALAAVLARRNPWAVAGVFAALRPVLKAVPAIMQARAEMLTGGRRPTR